MNRLEEIKDYIVRTSDSDPLADDCRWLISECERLTAENEKMRESLTVIANSWPISHECSAQAHAGLCLASLKRGEGE